MTDKYKVFDAMGVEVFEYQADAPAYLEEYPLATFTHTAQTRAPVLAYGGQRLIRIDQFMSLFTLAEHGAFLAYVANLANPYALPLRALDERLKVLPKINLDHLVTASGVGLWALAGIITQERAAQVLAGHIHEEFIEV